MPMLRDRETKTFLDLLVLHTQHPVNEANTLYIGKRRLSHSKYPLFEPTQ